MKKIILVLENLRSVENTGSIFRTADAMGVEKIVLVGTTPAPVDRFGRKRQDFSKVSLGAEEAVPWEHVSSARECLAELKESGFDILALELTENSTDISHFKTQDKFALVVGSETDGISPAVLELADRILEIPMHGTKESLNVSVAAGIALFVLR